MKPSLIVLSVLIVVFAVLYGLTRLVPWAGEDRSFLAGEPVDEAVEVSLEGVSELTLRSNLSAVRVKVDPAATVARATLTGSIYGFGPSNRPLLWSETNGSTARIQAGQNGPHFFIGSQHLLLEITLPASYAANLSCESAAGAMEITSPLTVAELQVSSSAGAVRMGDATVTGALTVNSSAGSVQAGLLTAGTIEVRSSAGSVRVAECRAQQITLHSSAGAVEAQALSGRAQVSSSAGPVTVTLTDLAGDTEVKSSAGSVEVRLPMSVNAALEANSSAGSVSVENLTLQDQKSERSRVTGTLGTGGPRLTVHSSAGSVQVIGQ